MVGNRPYSHGVRDIYIPVVPIPLRIGHEQLTIRDKKLSCRFSLIIPPYFKDQIVAWMLL